MKHFSQNFLVLSCCFFLSFPVLAQKNIVRETVIDNHGISMLGNSIMIKVATAGNPSGFDGKYRVQISPTGVFVFSFPLTKTIEVSVGEKKKKLH